VGQVEFDTSLLDLQIFDAPERNPSSFHTQQNGGWQHEGNSREGEGNSQRAREEAAKPYNENAMNVVMVGAECAPWSKTGLCTPPRFSRSWLGWA